MAATKLPAQATGANIRSAVANHADNIDTLTETAVSQAASLNTKLPTDTYTENKTTTDAAIAGKVSQSSFDAYKTSNDAAVGAISPTIQPETAAFVAKHIAKSFRLTSDEINAVDSFYVKGKNDGWLSLLKVAWCPMGVNLAASLIKLVDSTGTAPEMVNNNFVESDYSTLLGFGTGATTNTNKFLGTGIIPANIGLASNNISWGSFIPDLTGVANSFFMGLNGTVISPIYIKKASTISGQDGITNSASSVNGVPPLVSTVSYGPSRFNGTQNNSIVINATTTTYTVVALDTEITLFKSRTSYSDGRMAFFFMGSELTPAQSKSIADAILDLSTALKRYNLSGGRSMFLGDSITQGTGATAGTQNRWASVTSTAIGSREFNVGKGSSELVRTPPNTLTGGIVAGQFRYRNTDNIFFNNVFCMYGTNDMNNNDSTTSGDATKIATYKSTLKTLIAYWKSLSLKVVILSPPFNAIGGTTNDVKRAAYQQASFEAADESSVLFVDTELVFTDTGAAASYFPDNLHPNDAGHKLIGDLASSVFLGKTYRNAAVDFPSVPANSTSAAITFTMKGAKPGMLVNVAYVPVDGIKVTGYVSANNVVSLKAENYTGAAIDMPSQAMKIVVNLN